MKNVSGVLPVAATPVPGLFFFRMCCFAKAHLSYPCHVGESLAMACICCTILSALGAGDGKCVICDSYVRPATLVRVCDECNYGSYAGRCVICGGIGVSDAYYCKECTLQEKDVSAMLATGAETALLMRCLYADISCVCGCVCCRGMGAPR